MKHPVLECLRSSGLLFLLSVPVGGETAAQNWTPEQKREDLAYLLEKLKEVPEAEGGLDAYADWDPYQKTNDEI